MTPKERLNKFVEMDKLVKELADFRVESRKKIFELRDTIKKLRNNKL